MCDSFYCLIIQVYLSLELFYGHFIQKFSQGWFNVIEELVTLEPLRLLPLVSKTKVPSCSSHMIVT